MNEGDAGSGAIAKFAERRRLSYSQRAEIPRNGALLCEDDLEVHGAASGELPGGEPGTLAYLSYTYRSGDSTRTARLTAVVLSVPESIGFVPYLAATTGGLAGGLPAGVQTHSLDIGEDVSVRVDSGASDDWLRELFSPALTDWLARSPEGFAVELADGVLRVSRDGYLTSAADLERLCEDAAHLAKALRAESVEEVETGGAKRSAAKLKPPDAVEAAALQRLIGEVDFEQPPADVAAAQIAYRDAVVRRPSTYLGGLLRGIAWTLAINVIGGGIYGLLLNLPNPLTWVIVFQVLVLVSATLLSTRGLISRRSAAAATEVFFREYARSRDLEFEDPLSFAAIHAKAELPGKPDRVLTGRFDGVNGSLVLVGDGLKRGDRIALVAGPSGPTAAADFEVSPPGVSARALDDYAKRLADELGREAKR